MLQNSGLIHKSIISLYTSNEQVEFEVQTKFTLTSRTEKFWYKFTQIWFYLRKPQDSGWMKWEEQIDILCHGLEEPMFVMMLALPKLIYRLNTIPIKIPASHLIDTIKWILKFTQWKAKDTE